MPRLFRGEGAAGSDPKPLWEPPRKYFQAVLNACPAGEGSAVYTPPLGLEARGSLQVPWPKVRPEGAPHRPCNGPAPLWGSSLQPSWLQMAKPKGARLSPKGQAWTAEASTAGLFEGGGQDWRGASDGLLDLADKSLAWPSPGRNTLG